MLTPGELVEKCADAQIRGDVNPTNKLQRVYIF